METNSILTANILDILFEGRNKEYGAYELRNTYNKRLNTALGVMAFVVMIFVVAVIGINTGDKSIMSPRTFDFDPQSPPPVKEKLKPEKQPVKPKPVKTLAFPPPIIVIDNLVTKLPVENDKLLDAVVGLKDIEGEIDKGIPSPIENPGNNLIETQVKNENTEDVIVDFAEVEAKFNGNWGAYVKKEIEKNMDELVEAGESGTCIVRFVVSKDGSVSNVEAITMKGSKLAEIAVHAIRKGPKWIPARQNGTIVNAYRQQPITFKITE